VSADTIHLTAWKIGWGFTSECNMHCAFCYSRSLRAESREVPLAIAKRFLHTNAAEIACINYGTGESTLVQDWFELIAFVRHEFPALRQALTTNGTLAAGRNQTAQKSAWAGALDEIDVSIDFADAARHNRMRGNPNAYAWAVRCLELCAEEGIPATIVCVGFAESLAPENLDRLLRLADRHRAFLRLNILRPAPQVKILSPTISQVHEGISWLLQNARVVSLCDPLLGALFDPDYRRTEATAFTSMRILPDGSITPSPYLITDEWKGASICQEELRLGDIGQSAAFQRIRHATHPRECFGCMHAEVCRGGAVDRRLLHFGTLERGDPYCPRLNRQPWPQAAALRRYPRHLSVPSIHDGYLPTLIFAP
jgi:radical SAM protein with 4Fe4S-binding SPASM domain